MDHFGFLLAAYSIIFAALFLYVIFLRNRQHRLEAELRTIAARLARLQNDLSSRPPPST